MSFLTLNSSKLEVAAASMAELVAFYNATTGKSIRKFETRAKGVERCNALIVANEKASLAISEGKEVDHPAGITPTTEPNAEVHKIARAEPSHVKARRKPSEGVVMARTPDGQLITKKVRGRAATAMDQLVATVRKPAAKKLKPAPKKSKSQAQRRKPAAKPRSGIVGTSRIMVVTKPNPKHGTAAERYDLYRTGMTVDAYIAAGGQRRDVLWDQAQGWIQVKL